MVDWQRTRDPPLPFFRRAYTISAGMMDSILKMDVSGKDSYMTEMLKGEDNAKHEIDSFNEKSEQRGINIEMNWGKKRGAQVESRT